MVENSLQNYSFYFPPSFIYSSDIIRNISKDVVFIYLKDTFAEYFKRIKILKDEELLTWGLKQLKKSFQNVKFFMINMLILHLI